MSLFELLRGTSDGVFAVDRDQRIAFWNDAARQILGFEADAVLGQYCYEVVGAKDESGGTVCKKRCANYLASLRGELSPTRDIHAHTSAGARKWISVTTFVLPARYHEQSLLAHVFRDASEAHRQELRLKEILARADTRSEPRPPSHARDRLTEREEEILRLLASGSSTTSICGRLGVEATTVRTHVQHILDKLGVHSRLEAVAYASHNGLLRSARE